MGLTRGTIRTMHDALLSKAPQLRPRRANPAKIGRLKAFSARSIRALTEKEIRGFSDRDLLAFSPRQLDAFTEEQISFFSASQIMTLVRYGRLQRRGIKEEKARQFLEHLQTLSVSRSDEALEYLAAQAVNGRR